MHQADKFDGAIQASLGAENHMVAETPVFPMIPTLQPGETIHSAILRLGRINGVINFIRLFKALLPEKTNLSVISEIFNQQQSDLLRNHTLLPLKDLFSTDETNTDGVVAPLRCKTYRLSRNYGTNLKICEACVQADLSTHGFSFWRRNHQLPGVLYCWEHNARLKNTKESDFLVLPHEISPNDAHDECPTPACSELEYRYNQLLQLIVNEPIRLSRGQMAVVLRRRIKELTSRPEYRHLGIQQTLRNYVGRRYSYDYSMLGSLGDDHCAYPPSKAGARYHLPTLIPERFLLIVSAVSESVEDALSLMSLGAK